MSTKKKKLLASWVKCDECGVIVSERDVVSHKDNCPPDFLDCVYPCVSNGVLRCKLSLHCNNDVAAKNVPSEDLDGLVFLSNLALQICGIPLGDFVEISNLSGDSVVRRAWKGHDRQELSASLFENDVAILKYSEGSTITVRSLSVPVDAAREIVVECSEAQCNDALLRLHQRNQKRIFCVGAQISVPYYGQTLVFKIKEIVPFSGEVVNNFYKALPDTIWRLNGADEVKEEAILLSKIGGLRSVIAEIEEILSVTLGSTAQHDILKIKGILLHGPSGTGKTLLVKALAKKWAKSVIDVNSNGECKLSNNNMENNLENCFLRAQRGSPSVIVIDDLDVLCVKRSPQDRQFASVLSALFDRLHSCKSQTVVIATTNDPNKIDRFLRRPGRFDKEIEVGVPTPQERLEILQALLGEDSVLMAQDLKTLADSAHGFVGADLAALLSKAVTMSFRDGSCLESSYLLRCLPLIRPSAMREVMVQVSDVRWDDIGGQEELKHQLRQAVEWPLKYPESFIRLGVNPPRGVLMYGPPGCSKTMVAKALATESGLNFISVKGPELFSKWVGESEKAVREVFRRARQVAPSIVFFDELDALAGERNAAAGGAQVQERVLAQLLTELDGVEALGHVIVVGATNRPDRIDPALLRPGRLDRVVYVPLPDELTRSDIFRIRFRKTPVAKDVVLSELAQLTDGYSGAEVVAVCNEAAMIALDEDLEIRDVSRKHFLSAIKRVSPRTTKTTLSFYEKYKKQDIK